MLQALSRCLGPCMQKKGVKRFDGIVSSKCRRELEGQKHLSLFCLNAGPKRGGVTSCIRGSLDVTMVPEAETHHSEIAKEVGQPFHVYQPTGVLVSLGNAEQVEEWTHSV